VNEEILSGQMVTENATAAGEIPYDREGRILEALELLEQVRKPLRC
jgi:hypothetical protein